MARRMDPVVQRLLAAVALAAMIAAGQTLGGQLRAPLPPCQTFPLPLRPARAGAHLATLGCIRASTATAADWRQVVGIGAAAAEGLVAACAEGRHRRPSGPTLRPCGALTDYGVLSGIGAKSTARLRQAICSPGSRAGVQAHQDWVGDSRPKASCRTRTASSV